ncbi:response regulator [Salipiger mangrovisoli]|uniref:Response regulator n=1 Tax=Salipiger mangrovisoli TaxID=2865933 RepID=A0ABR9X797_9RHOB|nr:response regulator [Salipiger mangrovisoli]MBE9639402.1 response regulator [Salipiger mangrovisoli]
MSLTSGKKTTARQRVMICEDEVIVAMDLQMLVEEFGYDVIGPFPGLREAFAALGSERPDIALLDVRLKDGEVFPLADRLRDMGVGLVFQSGHVYDDEIHAKYPKAGCCLKPISPAGLRSALQSAESLSTA